MPFRDVVGHQAILSLLARALGRDALPQSLIFAGPDGVGKRLSAISLAQALNCVRLPEASFDSPYAVDACG